jgi:cytochrome b
MNTSSHAPSLPRGALFVLVALVALLAGAGMAGWLDHGASIFLAMASDAWAYCF